MTDLELINFVKEKVENSPFGYFKSIGQYKDRLQKLFKVETGDFKNNLYHLLYDIEEIPICAICNKEPACFRGISKGYGRTCSSKCSSVLGGQGRKKADPNKHIKKMHETNLKKFGSKSPLGNREVKEKQEQTMLERYGARHAVHSETLIKKTKETVNNRYGVDYWYQSDQSRKNSSETITKLHQINHFKNYFMDKYGVSNWYQTEEGLRHLLKLRNAEHLFDEIEKHLCGDRIPKIASKLNITPYMLKRIIDFKEIIYRPKCIGSQFEDSIYEFLLTLLGSNEIIRNDRSVLDGFEIDILLPNKNIGIECNGIFWHSEEFKNKDYHRKKQILAEEKGINLIQITDLFYYGNEEKWHNLLKNKIGLSKRLYARNLRLTEISDTKTIRKFIDKNHLQGFAAASKYLALIDDTCNIMAIASFSKSRYNSKYDYELVRFCSLSEYTIVGGFSKLLKYFIRNNMDIGDTLLSYANCFWSNGSVYEKNGFKLTGHTGSNYIWTDAKTYIPRYKSQKHKLIKEYGLIVESEVDFMTNFMGMKRYYDAGNKIYVYTKKGGD